MAVAAFDTLTAATSHQRHQQQQQQHMAYTVAGGGRGNVMDLKATQQHDHHSPHRLHTASDTAASTAPSTSDLQMVVLCLLWYGSSAVTNNIGKQLLQLAHIPVTLTYVQFAFVSCACFCVGHVVRFRDAQLVAKLNAAAVPFESQPPLLHRFWEWIQLPAARMSARSMLFMAAWSSAMAPSSRTSPHIRDRLRHGVAWALVTLLCWMVVALRVMLRFLFFWLTLGLDMQSDVKPRRTDASWLGRIRAPSMRIILSIAPLSCFLLSGHVFSSIALDKVPVAFLHTVKALSPLFTVAIYRFYFKTIYSSAIYISLVPLTLGVMLACAGELAFTAFGLFCALSSTLIFVVQNIFSKGLFRSKGVDKLSTLFYSSSIAFLLMSPIWFWLEGGRLLTSATSSSGTAPSDPSETVVVSMWRVVQLTVMNGTAHFFQNVFAFAVLHSVSPVTYSIASLLKRIVVIVASIVWFRQLVSLTQVVGVVLAMGGLAMYQRARHHGGGEREISRGKSDESVDITTPLQPLPKSQLIDAKPPPRSFSVDQNSLHRQTGASVPPGHRSEASLLVPSNAVDKSNRLEQTPADVALFSHTNIVT